MVKPALLQDRQDVISIIEESFHDNPSVVSVINPAKPKSLRALAAYAFDTAIARQGIWLSADRQAVAICYDYNYKKEGLKDLWNQVLLVINCIGLSRLRGVMHREKYVKKIRPKDGRFLYFWFFGATEKGKTSAAAVELKNAIFELSKDRQLPICLETSVSRNMRVYERFGFETYHEWCQSDDKTLYFMRRPY